MVPLPVRFDPRADVIDDVIADVIQGLSVTPAPLSRWLGGRWGLLFSHADDFASYGFEADRWLVHLRDAFETLDLGALAIGDDAWVDELDWISQIGGRHVSSDLIEHLGLPEHRAGGEHFVTILDDAGRARRTFLYRAGNDTPSPIALAQTAAHLRSHGLPFSVRRIPQPV